MALDAVYRGYQIALHIDFDKAAGEGHIHTVLTAVISNSLHMLALPAEKYF